MLVMLVLTALLLPLELAGLRRDTLAAVGYVSNWYLIASRQSYFEAVERPALQQHLWSLAIEEQFYILWPLVFAVGMRLLRATGLLALTLLAAIASATLMAVLYYGTDTRASALLFGAALALVWAPSRTPATTHRFNSCVSFFALQGEKRYTGKIWCARLRRTTPQRTRVYERRRTPCRSVARADRPSPKPGESGAARAA
jgi:peptidoglycan/LPS O-acetylase OafA/YrhL